MRRLTFLLLLILLTSGNVLRVPYPSNEDWVTITDADWVLNQAGANYAPWVQTYTGSTFRVTSGINGSTGHTWRINNQPSTNSIRVRMKMQWTGTAAFTPEIGFTVGAQGTYHGWGVIVDPARVVLMTGTTERLQFAFATSSGVPFWVDFATDGNTLYAKAYLDGDTPPTSWNVSQLITPSLAAGQIGVMWRSPFTTQGDWLVIQKTSFP